MRISAPFRRDMQRRLFEEPYGDCPLGNHGHVRTLLGRWTEELTAGLFGGVRHITDSRCDYCPDVSVGGGQLYIECKCAGRSRQTFIYEGRVEKDRKFSTEHPLIYAVWVHHLATKTCQTIEELRAGYMRDLEGVILIPFSEIDSIVQTLALEKLNSAYGHRGNDADKVYGSGYRLPVVRLLNSVCSFIPWEPMQWDC